MRQLIFGLNKLKINNNKRTLNIENVEFKLDDKKSAIAIVGESGIGKTSIFKSLFSAYVKYWHSNHNLQLECKHIINNKELSDSNLLNGAASNNFGFATQIPYFENSKSVRYNLFLPLKWLKLKWGETEKEQFVDKFQINEIVDADMFELSGGQRQIINIARVFLSNPELVVIDECFSNMNKEMAQKYMDILKTNYPDCIFLITSHRTDDIAYFDAQEIHIVLKQHKNGIKYVSQA